MENSWNETLRVVDSVEERVRASVEERVRASVETRKRIRHVGWKTENRL